MENRYKEFKIVQLNEINTAAGPIGKVIEDLEKRVFALEEQIQIQHKEGIVTIAGIENKFELEPLVERVIDALRGENANKK